MKQTSINYAIVLYDLQIPESAVEETKDVLGSSKELINSLMSPIVPMQSKFNIIDKLFPKEIHNFLKVLCKNHDIDSVFEIFEAYKNYTYDKKGILSATLFYVTMPDDNQLAKFKTYLCNKFNKNSVELKCVNAPELIGGFVIDADGVEINRSVKGKIEQLQQKLVKR